MPNNEQVIAQTQNWISLVVVGCNFCPFAKPVLNKGGIHFEVGRTVVGQTFLEAFLLECRRLDETASIETTLIIYPLDFVDFDDFLNWLHQAECALTDNNYDGIYQVASFHPDYRFSYDTDDDPANYTNRSPYPMLHLLRESSVTIATDQHPDPEGIPDRNIKYARKKGLAFMQHLKEVSMVSKKI